jgi:hypothetical protein
MQIGLVWFPRKTPTSSGNGFGKIVIITLAPGLAKQKKIS